MMMELISPHTYVLKVCDKIELYTMLFVLILRREEWWMNAYNSDP